MLWLEMSPLDDYGGGGKELFIEKCSKQRLVVND